MEKKNVKMEKNFTKNDEFIIGRLFVGNGHKRIAKRKAMKLSWKRRYHMDRH